jgi:crossover junction endodeoxyribonuclease RuvC
VLGVDPGTQRTGWGVIDRSGNRLRGVAAGVIHLRARDSLERRLACLFDELSGIVRDHGPAVVAVEDIFFAKHANAALKLGHARGVALLVAARADLEVHAYPPAVVKQTVAGRGSAGKEQVSALVGALLGWTKLPSVDATDALAVAITHAHAAHFAQAVRRSR